MVRKAPSLPGSRLLKGITHTGFSRLKPSTVRSEPSTPPASRVSAGLVFRISVLYLWVTPSSLPLRRSQLLYSVPVMAGKESPFSLPRFRQVPLVVAVFKANQLGTFMFCSLKFSCITAAFSWGIQSGPFPASPRASVL